MTRIWHLRSLVYSALPENLFILRLLIQTAKWILFISAKSPSVPMSSLVVEKSFSNAFFRQHLLLCQALWAERKRSLPSPSPFAKHISTLALTEWVLRSAPKSALSIANWDWRRHSIFTAAEKLVDYLYKSCWNCARVMRWPQSAATRSAAAFNPAWH